MDTSLVQPVRYRGRRKTVSRMSEAQIPALTPDQNWPTPDKAIQNESISRMDMLMDMGEILVRVVNVGMIPIRVGKKNGVLQYVGYRHNQ